MKDKTKLIGIAVLCAVLIAVFLTMLFDKSVNTTTNQEKVSVTKATETVAGVDADNNGIRDDVDAFIDENYKDESKNKAARQLARSIQDSLLVDKLDNEAVNLVAHSKVRAFGCIYNHFDADEANDSVIRDITGIVLDKNIRLKEYADFNQVLDGVELDIPSEGACDF